MNPAEDNDSPFRLVLPRQPPSSNKGPNPKFQNTLRKRATAAFGNNRRLVGMLYCRITWFHHVPVSTDIDNIPKNILDALNGTVFDDDLSIVQCLIGRIDARQSYELRPDGLGTKATQEMATLLEAETDHVLYIEIGQVEMPAIGFGPIEEITT